MMRLGLVHLELSSAPIAPEHYQPGGNNSRLFNLLAEGGISVAVLRLAGMTYAQKIAAIEDAGKRGIPTVLDSVERLTFPDLVDRLRTYALCAARAGVHFILENDTFTSCDSAEAQLGLARVIQHPALGFAFAPPHALADNLDPADEIRALGPNLKLAYLWDASVGMRPVIAGESFDPGPPEHQTPGSDQGRLDWSDYFQALAEIGFRGIFNMAWLGTESWANFQIEEALRESIIYCSEMATDAGLAK